jgi:hypothetical protein
MTFVSVMQNRNTKSLFLLGLCPTQHKTAEFKAEIVASKKAF